MLSYNEGAEWLEADGLGGFAMGTATGIRTRRYHALLLAALTPPTGRTVLVNGFDAWVDVGPRGGAGPGSTGPQDDVQYLTTHRYLPDVLFPDGHSRLVDFDADPWPTWTYRLSDGAEIEQELFVPRGKAAVALRWRLLTKRPGVTLTVRPFLSGRDSHALHHENPVLRFDAERNGDRVRWQPYASLPPIVSLANAEYTHQPVWYRNVLLEEEKARGLDFVEDLAAPGLLQWNLSEGPAIWILHAEGVQKAEAIGDGSAAAIFAGLHAWERRRRARFPSPLHRAADAYIVRRGEGKTIVAGYPWFTDWGRDTFIALRGLCLAAGRLDDARQILVQWAEAVDEGMLPNRFVDQGDAPEFNSVDASLWYVIAVHDYLQALSARGRRVPARERQALREAVEAILTGYADGTRYHIHADGDGLLFAGEPGVQLTWMDAKVGDWVVTPRIGKPVEVQALWLNALRIGGAHSDRWSALYQRGRVSFEERFWNAARGCLFDVVDPDGRSGEADPTLRPNQIFAIGGLPYALIEGPRARQIVDTVEAQLWTPLGPRSLAPSEPGYAPRYQGGVVERDGSYHQGTVWPWLAGAFIEAWMRVRGHTDEARDIAREWFLGPLLRHLDEGGIGHISEIADADPPHTPRGCPFQAWSVGEALRLDQVVLAPASPALARGGVDQVHA